MLFVNRKSEILAYATALSESAFTLAMQSQEIRGGIGNTLKFNYKNTRTLNISLTNVAFSKSFLPLNLGQITDNSEIAIANEECLIVDATGNITLEKTPIGVVSIVLPNGIIRPEQNPTHETTLYLGIEYAGQKITAIYDYKEVIDNIVIDSSTPPSIVRLVLNVQIRSNETNGVVEWLQLDIPSFQIDGNYELSMTAGMALSVSGQQCADGDVYGYIKYVPVAEVSAAVANIAATPSPMNLEAGEHGNITVYGLRGSGYAPIILTSQCTYSKTGDEDISVSNEGIVSVSSGATAEDTATILVTYTAGSSSYTDTVIVNVTE